MPTNTLARWRDNVFAPFEAGGGLFPFVAPEIRVEQYVKDEHLVVRAEIPGVDPEKDVDVTVADGLLRIRVERTEEKRDRTHTEFHYGSLLRTVPLPAGAMEETATAKYDHGILEVSFTIGEPREPGRHIAIDIAKETATKEAAKPKK
jgi:HSP20 family protein